MVVDRHVRGAETTPEGTAPDVGRPTTGGLLTVIPRWARETGTALDHDVRSSMEQRLGADLSDVRIHAGSDGARAAAAVGARAATVGRSIYFADAQYQPDSARGRTLLEHELVHVVQQRGAGTADDRTGAHATSGLPVSHPSDAAEQEANAMAGQPRTAPGPPRQRVGPTVQRELYAYNAQHTTTMPSTSMSGQPSMWTSYEEATGDASRIRAALSALITAGKVGYRTFEDGIVFSASGATHAELEAALSAAGFPRAGDMATAVLSTHDLQVYSQQRVQKMSGLWTMRTGSQTETLQTQARRGLTSSEQAEATRVFGTSLDYGRVRIEEDPIMGAGSIARTTPWTINFPTGSTSSAGFVPWLIHELTHSWQYQHGVGLPTTFCTAVAAYALPNWMYAGYDYGGDAGLTAATSAGRGFRTFNTEQQGDILRNYYRALVAGRSTAVFTPFVTEVRGLPPSP